MSYSVGTTAIGRSSLGRIARRAARAVAACAAVGLVVASLAPGAALADKPADKSADKPASKPAEDARKTTLSDAEAQRFYAFFERLTAIVVASRDDCVKMAAGINAHVDANQPLLAALTEARNQNRQLPPSIKDKIARKFAGELEPAMRKKCAGDRLVHEALARIRPAVPRDRDRDADRERHENADHERQHD